MLGRAYYQVLTGQSNCRVSPLTAWRAPGLRGCTQTTRPAQKHSQILTGYPHSVLPLPKAPPSTTRVSMQADHSTKEPAISLAWVSLGTPAEELRLEFTLPTGQSFRWHLTSENEYTGVIGQRVVQLRQEPNDVLYRVLARGPDTASAEDHAAIADYFNLGHKLSQLTPQWARSCSRFRAVSPFFPGARLLRQDPVECLFQFICSSNNHISRIHGMVERLCAAYGTPLHAVTAADNETAGAQYGLQDTVANGTVGQAQQQQQQQLLQPSASVPVYIKAEHITQEAGTYAALSSVAKAAARMPRGRLSDTSLGSGGPAKKEEAELNAEFCTGVTDATLVPSSSGHLHSSPPMRPASKQGLKRAGSAPASSPVKVEAAVKSSSPSTYYAFPTVEQLQRATDQELRDAGFGYRAKFVTGSVALLSDKPGGGGQAWLLGLRQLPFEQAVEELSALPGVGPKVAACVSLFSLDKLNAIPVDTHVWQIAVRYYAPHLASKALTKKMHDQVMDLFVSRFGDYAGWAHNTLFIAELASQQHHLPQHLRNSAAKAKARKGKATSKANADSGESEEDDQESLVDMKRQGNDSGMEAEGAASGGKEGRGAVRKARATATQRLRQSVSAAGSMDIDASPPDSEAGDGKDSDVNSEVYAPSGSATTSSSDDGGNALAGGNGGEEVANGLSGRPSKRSKASGKGKAVVATGGAGKLAKAASSKAGTLQKMGSMSAGPAVVGKAGADGSMACTGVERKGPKAKHESKSRYDDLNEFDDLVS